MNPIDYFRKYIRNDYRDYLNKSRYVYLYTENGIVTSISFTYRKKNKGKYINDCPHDKLTLTYENKVLPANVGVQFKFAPFDAVLFEL